MRGCIIVNVKTLKKTWIRARAVLEDAIFIVFDRLLSSGLRSITISWKRNRTEIPTSPNLTYFFIRHFAGNGKVLPFILHIRRRNKWPILFVQLSEIIQHHPKYIPTVSPKFYFCFIPSTIILTQTLADIMRFITMTTTSIHFTCSLSHTYLISRLWAPFFHWTIITKNSTFLKNIMRLVGIKTNINTDKRICRIFKTLFFVYNKKIK